MDLFQFIDAIFKKKAEVLALSDYEKGKHAFMLNRLCSAQFPLQAAYLSQMGVNSARIVDYWINTLSKLYTSTPSFFYTKTSTKKLDEKKASSKNWKPTSSDIELFCQYSNMTRRDARSYFEFFPDDMKKEIEKFKLL
jgi:hypothetical protein